MHAPGSSTHGGITLLSADNGNKKGAKSLSPLAESEVNASGFSH
jgi:hypothetical protein